ncbi:S-adenosyl-L-methionine-dependent methyltransferase [Spinellus fusiger]|nr:S-adenosyl-L-methionine-dependent methyltransferase [Spinellus fusiger]
MSSQIAFESSQVGFRWEGRRRLADQEDVAYLLPSDQGEVDRLKMNHILSRMVLKGLFKSPIEDQLKKGIRVLDIGCGPGWWTLDMARDYPNSQFVAIDMADVFVTENLPPNVTFHVSNAGNGLMFEDNSFDFVFQRYLVMGFSVQQYKKSIQEMKRVLKPSGRMEVLEFVVDYIDGGPALQQVTDWISQAMTARNLDCFIADHISDYFQKAGLSEIKDIQYTIPIGSWGGECGERFLAIQRLALPAVKVLVTELVGILPEEYERVMQRAFEEADTYETTTRLRLIHGQKVLTQ